MEEFAHKVRKTDTLIWIALSVVLKTWFCGKFSQLFRTRLCLLNMGDPLIWAELTDNRQVSVLLFCMKWSPGLSDLAPVFRDEQVCNINHA